MITPEEIKKLSRAYAEDVFGKGDYYFKEDDMCNAEEDFESVVTFLSKDFCIIPKSKVKEWECIVEDALKADRVITEDAWRFMWERLFGKDTFEEEGK